MTIELPLWLVIAFTVAFILITLYLATGDLIAKVLYKKFKEEEKENER